MYKRRETTFTAAKTFYRPAELVEILNMPADKIIKYAKAAGAIYAINSIRLVNLPLLLDVFDKCGTLSEKTESLYIEIDKAAEELGLTERVIEEIASRADALYQIGDLKMVNISETDKYIRKFQTTVHDDTDIEETKKIRGSKFVREIMKKH